jgi:hypothetical protein
MRINNSQTNYFNNDVIIYGGLSALSGTSFTNTIFTTTSALSVVNTGVGPALYVAQAAGNYDIASFYDLDGVEVLHIGNAPGGGNPKGKIGINESNPGAELTVNGAISSNKSISAVSMQAFNTMGVGTYAPNYFNLDVNGVAGNGSIGSSYGNLDLGASGNITINPNNNVLLVTSVGNMGVGTTAPLAKLTVNGAISGNDGITVAGGNSNQWNSSWTTTNTNSANWNSAYTNVNYTSARNIQPFVFTSNNFNLSGNNNTYNMFTVPVGYRFSADFLQIVVTDTPIGGAAFNVQLQRSSDGQAIIGTLPVPASAGKYDIFSVANNNTTATRRFTVDSNQSVRLSGSSTYTTLSCVALIKGSLIPNSLFV